MNNTDIIEIIVANCVTQPNTNTMSFTDLERRLLD